MFFLRVHHLNVFESDLKRFAMKKDDTPQILFDINLNLQKGEIFGVVGPSGCGKTILLKSIAGLIPPTECEIYQGDKEITALPPHQRDISMVFQSIALYPHMTSLGNIYFPLNLHSGKKDISPDANITAIAEMLHINKDLILNRQPKYSSTGEQQRVAIGKAIAVMPEILLLDEPLSNIEDNLRLEIRHGLKKLAKSHNLTVVYVSHNQIEIGEISDNIAVMNQGVLEQIDTYQGLYENPKTLFVSRFIGEKPVNFLDSKEVHRLTSGKIGYSLTIRPEECTLTPVENCISISGRVSFVEKLIQENRKLVFIDHNRELFGVADALNSPIDRGEKVTIHIPLKDAKYFDTNDPDNARRIYNLW